MNARVVFLCGPVQSGKTTLAKRLVQEGWIAQLNPLEIYVNRVGKMPDSWSADDQLRFVQFMADEWTMDAIRTMHEMRRPVVVERCVIDSLVWTKDYYPHRYREAMNVARRVVDVLNSDEVRVVLLEPVKRVYERKPVRRFEDVVRQASHYFMFREVMSELGVRYRELSAVDVDRRVKEVINLCKM